MKEMISRFMQVLPKRLVAATAITMAIILPVSATAADIRLEGSMGVANVTAGDTQYKDAVNASYDQVVKVQVYYHNREAADSGKVANNLRVKIAMPTTPGQSQVIRGTISADNANTIQDQVNVNLDRPDAYLEYIPGSAVWKHNKGTNENVQIVEEKISDDVVLGANGAVIENAKPCFNFDATITVLARVRVPGVQVTKQVRVKGQTTWTTNNTAKPGETLEYQIAYKNVGNSAHKNVLIRDNLPPKLQYVAGSTKLKNDAGIKNVVDGVTTSGIVVGNYNPGAAAYVLFEVKVPGVDQLACGDTQFRNVGIVRPEGMNEFYNTATTTVTRVCEEQPKAPVCDMVELKKLGGRKVSATVKYTANGATFKNATYNFGDGTTPLVSDKTTVEHTYAKDGNYSVAVTLRFTVNGQERVVSGDKCAANISFATPTTPTTPTTLPKTGAGDVLGLFVATTFGGALMHRIVLNRRSL